MTTPLDDLHTKQVLGEADHTLIEEMNIIQRAEQNAQLMDTTHPLGFLLRFLEDFHFS